MKKVYIILLVSIMVFLSSCATNNINSYPTERIQKNPYPQLDPRDF